MENDDTNFDDDVRVNAITGKIIGAAYTVSNTLGIGFLEEVYHNALIVELNRLGLATRKKTPVEVRYRDVVVGNYEPDLIVEDTVLVELKSVERLIEAHTAQCLNYLKATGKHFCLLINFGKSKVEVKRFRK